MELRHLRSFLAVAEGLSFTRAAAQLHLSQPALTAHIQQLESDLGVQLFVRNRRSVELTPAGSSLREDAATVLRTLEEATLRTQRVARGEAGELRIGFVASAASRLVPAIVLAFRRRYPEVVLNLLNVRSAEQIPQLEMGQLDAGFLRLPAADAHLEITPIHKEPFVLVMPKGHRLEAVEALHPREARGEEFLAYGRRWAPGFFDCWTGIFERAGFTPRITQETGEMSTLLALVAAGAGIAVVPRGLAIRSGEQITTRPLPARSALSEIGFATRLNDANPLLQRLRTLSRGMGRKFSDS
jgi:DNA-binding transcriptional LysR family regulator